MAVWPHKPLQQSMEAVLRERQVHSNSTGQPIELLSSKEAQQPVKSSGQEQALARLQAQRTKRAEQRLVAAVATPPAGVHDGATVTSTLSSSNIYVLGQPKPSVLGCSSSRRLRAKVTTTVGTGMQRQAPSRCSSAACSVRSSLEMQTQQAQHTSAGYVIQSLFSSAHKPAGLLQAGRGLQVAGISVSKPQRHQQQQRQHDTATRTAQTAACGSHGGRSSFSLRPQCQPALLCAPAAATRPSQGQAASAIAHVLDTAFMGCGAPWAELQTAVVGAGAGAVQPPRAGSNLEHRHRVQQCR